jgi:SAM-dependent methyltransferase
MIDRDLNYGRHHIERFIRDAGPVGIALDLGAGHGTDLALARKCWPGAQLHAVEFWPPYVAEMVNQGIEVHSLNIERDPLPFLDGSVDVVLANQILEHTKELYWIFHEVSRVLKPGGSFIIGVPNLASLHNRLLLLLGRQPTPIRSASAHVRGFTESDLRDFVASCFPGGYTVLGRGGANFYPFPSSVAQLLARVLPSMAWGLFLRFVKSADYGAQFIEYPIRERLETNFYLGPSGY